MKTTRSVQSLSRFYKIVSKHTGLEKADAEEVTWTLLQFIVRRLQPREAMHFTSQLPHDLKVNLQEISNGPDRHFNSAQILDQVANELNVDVGRAQEIIKQVSEGLNEFFGSNEVGHVSMQLPIDIRVLLLGSSEGLQ